jgi:DNA-binding NtrC family response regulator
MSIARRASWWDLLVTTSCSVLLIEEAPAVRHFVRRTLERNGYLVVEANSHDEAVALADRGVRIDLLMTDVLPAGSNGPGLAGQLARRNPRMRVLWMSGYADELAPMSSIAPDQPFTVLQTPVSASRLAQAVRDLLDAPE